MPTELPTIHVGSIEKYQSARSGSREELLAEQDAMEQILVKNAAARGVTLMGAVETMRRSTAAAAAVPSTAAVPAAAAVSANAAVPAADAVSAAAAVSDGGKRKRAAAASSTAFSSRGRRLRPRQMSPESDD
jgi:hypothetical protein